MYDKDLFDRVEKLYDQFEEVCGDNQLTKREQRQLGKMRTQLDGVYSSIEARHTLNEVRWDRISENARGFGGDIPGIIGVPDDFSVTDEEYSEMTTEIDNCVNNIVDNLQRIEELANELDEERLEN